MSRKLNKNSQPWLVTITKKVEKKGKTALFIQNSKSYCYKSIGTFKKDIDENKDKKITRNISVSLPMNGEFLSLNFRWNKCWKRNKGSSLLNCWWRDPRYWWRLSQLNKYFNIHWNNMEREGKRFTEEEVNKLVKLMLVMILKIFPYLTAISNRGLLIYQRYYLASIQNSQNLSRKEMDMLTRHFMIRSEEIMIMTTTTTTIMMKEMFEAKCIQKYLFLKRIWILLKS